MPSKRSYKTINFLLSVVLLMIYSCGQLEVASIEVVNLFDPSDDEYSRPDTEIIDSPNSGIALDSSSTVITWQHSEPNYNYDPTHEVDYAERIYYRYRLNTVTWSPWYNGINLMERQLGFWSFDTLSGFHVLQFDYLEDINYQLEIMSKYPTNIQEENWPDISFSVDVYEGTELLISPGQVFADSGGVFFVNAKLIDVTDFMGLHLEVTYDNSFMQLQNYYLESDSTDFLLQSEGQLINFVESDPQNGHFQLDLGVAGGSVTGVSGTGNVVRLVFEHIGEIGQRTITISSESSVRDVYNNSVVQHIFPGMVFIW